MNIWTEPSINGSHSCAAKLSTLWAVMIGRCKNFELRAPRMAEQKHRVQSATLWLRWANLRKPRKPLIKL